MVAVKLFFLCIGIFVLVDNGGAVSFIDPCKQDDNACILKSANKAKAFVIAGVPEYGIAPFDPLVIKTAVASKGDLDLTFHALKIEGLGKCDIAKVERNLKKSDLTLELDCPFIATGKYEAKGKVTFVPVEGNGDFIIKSDKIKIIAVVKIKTVDGKDGKKYWEVKRHRVDLQPIKKSHLEFKNLFNGDKDKAAPVIALLDSSPDELVVQFGKAIVEQIVEELLLNLKQILTETATSELEIV